MTRFLSIFIVIVLLPSCLYSDDYVYRWSWEHAPNVQKEHRHILDLQTNLVPWGAGIFNLAGEVLVNNKLSVNLPVMWSPWFVSRRFGVRIFSFQPELRYWPGWFSGKHFIGCHFSVAQFNVQYKDYRYQDFGHPLLGAGISYGYRLEFASRFGMEFTVGAGVMFLKYERYANIANGPLIDRRQTTYFGLDNAGISFFYSL